jgi:hypothetical protein
MALAGGLDDQDQLVNAIARLTREAHEFACSSDDCPALGGACDVDSASAAELEQASPRSRRVAVAGATLAKATSGGCRNSLTTP